MRTSNKLRWMSGGVVVAVMAMMLMMFAGSATPVAANDKTIYFDMVPSSAAISACLPYAGAQVQITSGKNGETMTLKVQGLAPNADYDFFVTQVPHAKFGISWYQSDLHTNKYGEGQATVRGIFSNETFSISPATIVTNGREDKPQTGATFGAVNQYHLGLWFNDPTVPFKLGCEPGATQPVVTPFNGEQNAGIQVLNTSNYDDNNGPLKQVTR